MREIELHYQKNIRELYRPHRQRQGQPESGEFLHQRTLHPVQDSDGRARAGLCVLLSGRALSGLRSVSDCPSRTGGCQRPSRQTGSQILQRKTDF